MRRGLLAMIALSLVPGFGAAQGASPDSSWVRPSDTVRVWSKALKVSGARGVVTRADLDTLGFIAPAGFRKLPREYVGEVASIQRIELLEGRRRSPLRMIGSTGLGGVVGAVGGAVIGVGVGVVLFEGYKEKYDYDEGDRVLAMFYGGAQGAAIGTVLGLIVGGIDGLRAQEKWRRVR